MSAKALGPCARKVLMNSRVSKAGKGDSGEEGREGAGRLGLGGAGTTGRTCLSGWEEEPRGDPEEERLQGDLDLRDLSCLAACETRPQRTCGNKKAVTRPL